MSYNPPSDPRLPTVQLEARQLSEASAAQAGRSYDIVDVWSHNLCQAFYEINAIVKKYPYIAMDTEFPGIVARPCGTFATVSEYHYQTLKVNVDILKLIQLGLSFFDENGNTPQDTCTYQFNFLFNMATDMYAADSISLLREAGLNFPRHETDGIDPVLFAELITMSGLLMMESIVFLSFHSGYDFGYLIKLLTSAPLPENEFAFFDTLKMFFPNIYDVKYLMKSCKSLKGGLEEVSKQLEIPRTGLSHQAGSDSLLTGLVFFRIKELYFEENIDEMKYSGHLFGLGICSVYAPTVSGSLYTNELHRSTMAAQAAVTGSSSFNYGTPTNSAPRMNMTSETQRRYNKGNERPMLRTGDSFHPPPVKPVDERLLLPLSSPAPPAPPAPPSS